MPKPSVSATRLAGRAPVAVTVTPGRTPPSGPTTRPSMAPVVVWAVAAAAAARPADSATDSKRPTDPPLLLHIPHLLPQEIAACRPSWRERREQVRRVDRSRRRTEQGKR